MNNDWQVRNWNSLLQPAQQWGSQPMQPMQPMQPTQQQWGMVVSPIDKILQIQQGSVFSDVDSNYHSERENLRRMSNRYILYVLVSFDKKFFNVGVTNSSIFDIESVGLVVMAVDISNLRHANKNVQGIDFIVSGITGFYAHAYSERDVVSIVYNIIVRCDTDSVSDSGAFIWWVDPVLDKHIRQTPDIQRVPKPLWLPKPVKSGVFNVSKIQSAWDDLVSPSPVTPQNPVVSVSKRVRNTNFTVGSFLQNIGGVKNGS